MATLISLKQLLRKHFGVEDLVNVKKDLIPSFSTIRLHFSLPQHNYEFKDEKENDDGIKRMDKLKEVNIDKVTWKSIKNDGLDLEYTVAIPRTIADALLKELKDSLVYFTGDLSRIKVFGKVYPLPRQQVAYGDPGITYTYSGTTVPALPWPAPIKLAYRYRNGNDHMGEHRDNEPELDPNYPIASISLGQERDFILKHKDARKPGKDKKDILTVKIKLEHGSVLLMNPPTNEVWYHSLPVRKKLLGSRINLTFRKMRKITS